MRSRYLLALGMMIISCIGLMAALDTRKAEVALQQVAETDKFKNPPVLPGILPDGTVQLPNLWKLRPAGRAMDVGDLPVNLAVHPSGQYLAVLHAGMREHEVMIVELQKARPRITNRVVIDQTFYGMCFSPDGRKLFASGGESEVVHEWDFERGMLSSPKAINLAGTADKLVIGGVSMDAAGRDLFVCGTWGDMVYRIPVANPNNRVSISVGNQPIEKKAEPKGNPPSPPDGRKDPNAEKKEAKKDAVPNPVHPYVCLVEPSGKRAFVSLWADQKIAVIDLEKNEVVDRWPTAEHPTEMVLSPKGDALYVACANSTKVSVIDPKTGKSLQTINCALHPQAPNGNTPNSLTLTPDGEMLFVANADNNNLAVFSVMDPTSAKPLGFIPTGWYPTSVRFNPADKKIYVSNGKGMLPRANRSGPTPFSTPANLPDYIGTLYRGSVTAIDLPTPEVLARYSKQAYACSPLRKNAEINAENVEVDNPIPQKIGDPSPIKHVIYVIKENRTYDQVFGDMPKGNGDPTLCLFPKNITPNHHKLVDQYVLLDNIYVEGEVSADGHEWSMGAYATDYVEKCWPLSYRGSLKGKFGYPSEGNNDYVARPSGGYIWDRCAEAKVSYRSYGEWVVNGKMNKDGTFEDGKASVKALEGHIDPQFRGYDLDYLDIKRAERFVSEWNRMEKEGKLPQFQIVRLPNDHTSGTRVGKPTPTAQVADNDLALGMLVEGISKTEAWKKTAIFVIEDDAQNGPDHVDAHRVVALVISPYCKRNHVDSTMYSTSSMLRTMELILGLQPMSQFDAAATPMYNSFTAKPNFAPYQHEVPQYDINKKNVAGAWGQEWSEKANLAKEDAADDILFNEVIWKSVKGEHSRMPSPVRAAFFLPKVSKKDDHDDDD